MEIQHHVDAWWILEHILYMLEIVAACFLVEGYFRWKDKKKAQLFDLGCDYCEEVKPLKKTPDKSGYLCKQCMNGYIAEHPELTPEQVAEIKKGFRKRRTKFKSKIKRRKHHGR